MSKSFEIVSVEDIFALPDIATGMRILKEWGISTKGLNNKELIQGALLQHWKTKETAQEEATEEITGGLKGAISRIKRNRDELISYYDEMLKYYRQLPQRHKASLSKVFPHLEDSSYKKIRELKSNECAILVAGESVAGKSSFINLLLGIDILPTSQLACTATFCEIRYGNQKLAVCHTKDGRKAKIDLSSQRGLEELKMAITYVTDDVDDNENECIEIYWPLEMLEDGIVVIDTPGIGTSKEMTDRIQQYMTKAFGCIYIINSASAGGIQGGRIMDFLRTVMNLSADKLNPNTTMFVCNKWEQVPSTEKDEVMKRNHYKLRQCYPDYKPEQVLSLSTERAKMAMVHGVILQDQKAVLKGINRLLPASLENKHEAYYRWLSMVIKRTQFNLKVSKHTSKENIEQLKQKIKSIENQMYNLRQNAKSSIKQLYVEVQNEADSLHYKIINLLSSQDFLDMLKSWNREKCPETSRKWKKVSSVASDLIAEKLTKSINDWERRNSVKLGIKDKIIGRFKKEFELMEDQMNDIEGMFLGDETRILSDLRRTIRRPNDKRDKRVKPKDKNQNLVGIGGVISVIGTLGKESKDVFRKYKRDNCQDKMSSATDLFIQNILNNTKQLKESLSKFVQKYAKCIDDIAELIPNFLEADQQMLESLREEAQQTMEDDSQTYLRHFVDLQSKLDLFFVDKMMHVDYDVSDIEWHWDDKLGKGSFAEVYHGVLNSNDGGRIDVALKKSIDKVDKRSVTDILLEDRTMREVKHENFITYYGNLLLRQRNGTYWVMLMECCAGSLKDVFIDTTSSYKIENPANETTISGQKGAIRNMAAYGIQLCQGLNFLHEKKLVHRDLKLENVLISNKQVVKLTDVGLTKPEVLISGTMTGSPVYMAPEVLNPTGVYNRSADIYSLGIMIWEMWYGIDAADHISPRLSKNIEVEVLMGLRPLLTLNVKPDESWIKLIESCWAREPRNRPSAKDVEKFLTRASA